MKRAYNSENNKQARMTKLGQMWLDVKYILTL